MKNVNLSRPGMCTNYHNDTEKPKSDGDIG